MNKVIMSGNLVADVELRYSQSGGENLAIGRFRLAVSRKKNREQADFIPCKCFGNQAEFAEKYFRKGSKVIVSGHLQTDSYTNKDGVKVNTFEIIVEDLEFAEKKAASEGGTVSRSGSNDGFMNLPEGLDGEFPFH